MLTRVRRRHLDAEPRLALRHHRVAEPDDEDAVYMLTIRMALFFIFDEDGMGCGEQSYTNGDPTEASFVKVPNEHVPQRFWDNMKKQQELQDADD